jgi:nitrous oxidase accessory protein NosD
MRSAIAVAVAAAVVAGGYEPGGVPQEPAPRPAPSGRVLQVGAGGIQAAVDRARPGDTVRLAPGTYRGPVEIRGASKRGVRLVGERATVRGAIRVRQSTAVTVRGIAVAGAVRVDDVARYALDGLRVSGGGISVRRSPGGTITGVLVQGSAGPGIALAASPPQVRASRTFVRDVTVRANAVGIALDAVRAVTITRARILGNATGVAAVGTREAVLTDSDVRGSRVGVSISAGDLLLAGNRLQSNVTDVVGLPGP